MSGQHGRGRPTQIIAVVNQKGGVGKTTTAVNLAACLAASGRRTLLVDVDPQANATSGVGLSTVAGTAGVYEGLLGRQEASTLIQRTEIAALYALPSGPELAGAEVELVNAHDRSFRLRDLLKPLRASFDFIIVDCPPSLNLLTLNALAAADGLIVPVQCEYYALEGLGRLLSTIELVRASINPELRIAGFLLTMFDTRNNLAHQVAREVRDHFGSLTYMSVIPRNVRLSESPSHGKPIILYDKMSTGAHSYLDLADEFLTSQLSGRPELRRAS